MESGLAGSLWPSSSIWCSKGLLRVQCYACHPKKLKKGLPIKIWTLELINSEYSTASKQSHMLRFCLNNLLFSYSELNQIPHNRIFQDKCSTFYRQVALSVTQLTMSMQWLIVYHSIINHKITLYLWDHQCEQLRQSGYFVFFHYNIQSSIY